MTATRIPPTSEFADREIVITREFDAPRDLVFSAFTDANHVAHWWGPNGFRTTTHEMSVKPGGVWRFVMHGPDGTDYPNRIVYDEVVRAERLVYSHGTGEDDGVADFKVRVTFEDESGRTKVTLRLRLASAEEREQKVKFGAIEGGKQTLARLGEYLPSMEFVIRRVFDAPRELVWKAWTEAERLKHWWGPKGWNVRVATMDLRPGGFFHYRLNTPSGEEMWGKFVYREIVAPERIVWINSFSDESGAVARNEWHKEWPLELWSMATFADRGAQTEVTIRMHPHDATEAERATFIAGLESMQQGWTGSLDQLRDYLANG